jgi:iron complex transport system permease protein
MGSVHLSFREITQALFRPAGGDDISLILHRFRLPRMWTAVVAGMALSVSGLLMQTTFRNPLAGPYVLGISAGASLGVAVLVLGFSSVLSFAAGTLAANTTLVVAAIAGATAVLLLIMAVSLRIRDIMTILILGIMFGSAVTALVSILQYFSNETMLKVFVVWTMGSLANVTGLQSLLLTLLVGTGVVLTFLLVKPLNTLLMGESYARSVGMEIRRIRLLIFLVTGILAGSVTAFCGPIGFVGIVVPHLARMLLRTSDHRRVLPATLLLGASLLLLGDILSHLPGEGGVLPINAVTAVLGIPLIIWMILQRQKLSSLM